MEKKENCNCHICHCYDMRLANAEIENTSLKAKLNLAVQLLSRSENWIELLSSCSNDRDSTELIVKQFLETVKDSKQTLEAK